MSLRIDDRVNDEMLDALARERSIETARAVSEARPAIAAPRLPPDAIELGTGGDGAAVGIDLGRLIKGRLLIQGNSGAGKSMLLRRLFEQSFGRVQQLLIDPDGEFVTLAEVLDVVVLTAADVGRVGGRAFALHLREHRYSAVLDLSDATAEDRLALAADVAAGLVEAPPEHHHPLLVLVDEAQTLAPRYDTGDATADTRKRAIGALADLMGRGRKRGLAGVVATQRLAETATAVVAKATNIIVGRTIFDRDLERSGALLGFTIGHSRALRTLNDGEFMGLGPALAGPRRVRFRSGPCRSRHKGEAPAIAAPPIIGAAQAAALLGAVPTPDAARPALAAATSTRGWSDSEDAVIRNGYAQGLKQAEIVHALTAAGHRLRSVSGISTRAQFLGLAKPRIASWSPEEDQAVVDGYTAGKRIADIMADLAAAGHDRTFPAVQMRAVHLGVSGDRVNRWTEEETAIAKAGLDEGKPHREVLSDLRAAGFHRGVTSIFKFAQKHGYNRAAEPWTLEDNDLLRERYTARVPPAEIARELGKSIGAVRSRASILGLKVRVPWTEAERRALIEACERGDRLIDAAARIGRPYPNVAKIAEKMGLSFRAPARAPQNGAVH